MGLSFRAEAKQLLQHLPKETTMFDLILAVAFILLVTTRYLGSLLSDSGQPVETAPSETIA